LDEGIVHFWRGINNFAWGIVVVAWGIVDIEKGIFVVEEGPFHSTEGAEKAAEPAKDKGVAGQGFDESPGVAGAALRLATNASERSTESEKEGPEAQETSVRQIWYPTHNKPASARPWLSHGPYRELLRWYDQAQSPPAAVIASEASQVPGP
jgi:hypothetical protein